MSDDFIPLNQSTPVSGRGRWQGKQQRFHQHNQSNHQHNHSNNQHNHGNQFSNGRGRGNNRWGNSPRYSSGGSDNNTSYNQDRNNIDAYLHPSMLQDPWAELRRTNNATSK